MRRIHILRPALLLAFILLPLAASAAQDRDSFTFILPDQALLKAAQAVLPFPLQTDSASFEGDLSIDSIDRLVIGDKIISLHGVVSGRNMLMQTKIGGQLIKLKLGHLTLPLSCDLHLRFDRKGKQLFVRPEMKNTQQPTGSKKGDVLLSLLAALGNREYPVDLEQILSLYPNPASNRPLRLEAVRVSAQNNELILGLRPLAAQ